MGAFNKIKTFFQKYKTADQNAQVANALPPSFFDPNHDEKVKQNRRKEFAETLARLKHFDIQLSSEKHNRNNMIEMPDISPKNITKSTNLSKLLDFVALDVETTGLKTGGNDVIEVSAVHFHNFEPVEIFTTLLRPRKPIPADASEINGITDDMVKDAPKFSEIVPALEQYLGKMPIVAHNAPFDIKHLFVNGLDSICNRTVYDTLQLSKKLCDSDILDHKLQTVCDYYQINFDNAHRASADAMACGILFVKMLIQSQEDCYQTCDLVEKANQRIASNC